MVPKSGDAKKIGQRDRAPAPKPLTSSCSDAILTGERRKRAFAAKVVGAKKQRTTKERGGCEEVDENASQMV